MIFHHTFNVEGCVYSTSRRGNKNYHRQDELEAHESPAVIKDLGNIKLNRKGGKPGSREARQNSSTAETRD